MTAIKDTTLNGAVIKYNGVTFGGSTSSFSMTPPEYSLTAEPVYDDADRAVTHLRYTLTVQTQVYESNAPLQNSQLQSIKYALEAPAKTLDIRGVGLGFTGIEPDVIWGPKPQPLRIVPVGLQAAELIWTIEFNGPPCRSSSDPGLLFSAFNYDIAWSVRGGLLTRVISGYVEIAQVAQAANPRKVRRTVDQVRENITIEVPQDFQRLSFDWRTSANKRRGDFSAIDQQLPGDPYPQGIERAAGAFTMETDPVSMVQSSIRFDATYTVAPERDKGLAALVFFTEMANKQREIANKAGKNGAVIPKQLSIRTGLYDAARTSSFSVTWQTTGCIQDVLLHSPWKPLVDSNYDKWRKSIEDTWNNRGVSQVEDDPTEDVVIDLCANVASMTVGKTRIKKRDQYKERSIRLGCPDIPAEASWLHYDVRVSLIRDEKTLVHRLAVAANAGVAVAGSALSASTLGIFPKFVASPNEQHAVERTGHPEQIVLIQMKGIRVGHAVNFPKLKTVAGHTATPIGKAVYKKWIIAQWGGCAVNAIHGYQKYLVKGYVDDFKNKQDPTKCGGEGAGDAL